jgi:hypothetical protein
VTSWLVRDEPRDEIVSVDIATTGAPAYDTCLAEAAWATRLDEGFQDDHRTWSLSLREQ